MHQDQFGNRPVAPLEGPINRQVPSHWQEEAPFDREPVHLPRRNIPVCSSIWGSSRETCSAFPLLKAQSPSPLVHLPVDGGGVPA